MEQKRKASALAVEPIFSAPPTRFQTPHPILPHGWIDCPETGHPIHGLIPSKVPLGSSFNEVIEAPKRYSVDDVCQHLHAQGRDVGMVIDLTNTSRYYDASKWWTQGGIRYLKIRCRGQGEVPDNASVNIFVYEVLRFMSLQRSTSMKHILVHCTHGFNRTGFMIVHYLKRSQPGMTVEQALAEFASARPPGIYKKHYINSLFSFFHERKPKTLVAPAAPDWKGMNGKANDEDDDSILTALVDVDGQTMTNDDTLGDAIPELQQREMQKLCYQCLHIDVPPHGSTLHFPGSHPVSLSISNLQLLRQRYYSVTWKADGTRYMMLITHDGCYLINRKFHFRRVQMRFPLKHALSKTHNLTLLDGEMVIDLIPETQQQKRRYLIYDIMMLNQKSLVQLPFHERLKKIEADVIGPRSHDRQTNQWYIYEAESFGVRRKIFSPLSIADHILHGVIKRLPHKSDGLIFQGWDDPYVARTNNFLLKWKYAHMNTVDFKFLVS